MGEINKPAHFLNIYEKLFKEFSDKKGRIMEIGIQSGESLKLWAKMLPAFQVIGVDIIDCKEFDTDRIKTLHMGQLDPRISDYRPFDIIIDDGGHKMSEQIGSFKLFYPNLKKGGLYIIEDLSTSYWQEFQDYPIPTTNFLKDLIDDVNREAFENKERCKLNKREFLEIDSISFHKYLCVIKK